MSNHIALVLPDLRGGGAERLTIDLARGFLERGARVDLVLLSAEGAFLDMVPDGARIVELGVERLRHAVLPLRRYMQTERPSAVLAAMWPLTSITILAGLGIANRPVIALADHCPLSQQFTGSWLQETMLRTSVRATYPMADAVIGVSAGLSDEIAGLAGIARRRVTTIYNPIPFPLRSKKRNTADWGSLAGKRILSVGSFKDAKNFPLLLRAFAPLAEQEKAVLAIVGTGPNHDALRHQAEQLGLGDRLMLPGFSATPGDWYETADMFVLPSNYEGFGNVLVEAMHCGLPVVSTDCPYGPAEILGRGRWGTLVPLNDEKALNAALAADPQQHDAAAVRKRAAEFSVERAVTAYWSILST